MEPIIKLEEGFQYMKFQPGDGTMYTAIFGNIDNDNMYIALGPGDMIQGGYFFRRSSARSMLVALREWVEGGGMPREFVQDYHLFHYHATKVNNKFNWTVAVFVFLSALLTVTSVHAGGMAYISETAGEGVFDLIKFVDRNNGEEVLSWLDTWAPLSFKVSDIDKED